MTRAPLCFEAVQVVQAPGFETGGFAVDGLSAGINVVHGPNAAGKTTLAAALEWLCWPEAADGRGSLVGHLSLEDEPWRVDLDTGRANYQRDGREANAPSLPPVDQRDRYRLSLHDLLQRDNANESFAEIIERESAGGYDLAAASSTLGYTASPSRANKNAVTEAERAVTELQNARNEVTELRQKQTKLSRLRSELEAARQASQRAERLEQALDYATARNELDQARTTLEALPEILAQVDGDELERVRRLDAEIDEWTEKHAAAESTRAESRDQLAEIDLPEEGVPTGRIDQLKALRDSLETAESRRRELEADLAEAERRRDTAREDIPLAVDTEALVELDPVTWRTVSRFAREAEKVQAEQEVRAEVQRLLEDGDRPDQALPTLQRASQALEEWLAAAGSAASDDGVAAFRIAAVSAASLTAAAVALGTLVHPLLFSVLAVAAGILWYGVRARSQASPGQDPRQPHRETFQQTGVHPPDAWTDEAVRSRLIELYDAIAAHTLADRRAEWRESLATDRASLEAKERDLADTRAELQAKLGAAPDADDVELAVLSKRVLDWQAAHDEVAGLQEGIDTATEQVETARETLQTKLAPYGYDAVDASGAATEAIRDLERREQERARAQRALDEATLTIEEATEKRDALEAERDGLFTALELEPGDHDGLRALCEQVDEYESADAAVREAEIRADAASEKLRSYPGFDPELERRAVAGLRDDLREAERTAEGFEELQRRISDIEAEIRQAKENDGVETALADRDRALAALEDQLEDDYAAMVGDVLVDHVQEATIESSRPAVFERARELLTTITRGRYRLDFDEQRTQFRAFDETRQKGLALDELSSGTRLQLLLAVRVAFVEQQEQGVQVPLLLDEALANSDDRRATTIIESAVELARNGRQIFYFTAQGDEVAKWKAVLENTNGVDHEIVDLASVREIEESVQIPDVGAANSFRTCVPHPDGHDHQSYRNELDVDPFNPHRGVGTTHLWYVVGDVKTLHQLLELGIERWGQVANLLRWGDGELQTVDDDELAVARENAAAVEAFADAWTVGRGEPVDRAVLEASGAVSGNFIDEVSALAESLDGDGKRLVEALRSGEVNRFRSGKAAELERYLEEHGYIEPRDALEGGQIRARVTERFVEEGVPRADATDRTDELFSRLEAN